jgi:hypothetical protein
MGLKVTVPKSQIPFFKLLFFGHGHGHWGINGRNHQFSRQNIFNVTPLSKTETCQNINIVTYEPNMSGLFNPRYIRSIYKKHSNSPRP